VKVREPIARPLDVVAAELLLSASQAFLVGVLFYLAVGVWDDRDVGTGPVAVIVAGLGVAVGGGWLYWLSGGVGWPLAAANVPTALFLGFALVLGWSGDDLFRVEGVPLLLGVAASVYGLVCGVFLDPPRRLRWDQRARPRPGTPVPRVSPTTLRIASQLPRSIPRRAALQPAELVAPRPEPAGQAAAVAPGIPSDADQEPAPGLDRPSHQDDGSAGTTEAAGVGTVPPEPAASSAAASSSQPEAPPTLGSMMPTARLEKMAATDAASAPTSGEPEAPSTPPAVELPTSIEPKAQKSPWAWAAPPEWTRDEDDEPPRRRSSKRS
jgi:hypothetical protein